MKLASWTAALRIARREAWRAKLRSVLVMLLVGLPVFVLAGADVLYRTWQLSPDQQLTRTIGASDASIRWLGNAGHVDQTPDGNSVGGIAVRPGPSGPPPSTADVLSHLPRGTRAIPERWDDTTLTFRTRSGIASSGVVGLDYADPIAAGIVSQISGRAPRTDREVALTTALANDTGLGVGDLLRTVDSSRSLRVVGLVQVRANQRDRNIFTLPSAVAAVRPTAAGIDLDGPSWLVDTPHPMTWQQVLALNKLGFVAVSRRVVVDPPPASELTVPPSRPANIHTIASATLVGGMILLEVVLLAGPAFTVGARRRRFELGLLAAVGGSRADLRRVVLADAVVLGSAAGILAGAAGIGAAAVAEPIVAKVVDPAPGPFQIPWAELCALALVSLVTALLAALVPAIRAARTDVVAALAGRRGIVRAGIVAPLIGAVLAASGIALALGALGSPTGGTVLIGMTLVEIGLIAMSPALIGAVTRLARWLPVSGRIALRDAGRNRAAAAPAVAAVMATVIGATAAGIAVASSDAYQRSLYMPQLPQRDAYVTLGAHPGDVDAVTAAIRSALPHAPVATVHAVSNACDPSFADPSSGCTVVQLRPPAGGMSERWLPGRLPNAVVDDGSAVDVLFGTPEPAAAAALRAGHVVVVDDAAVRHGQVTVTAERDAGSEREVTAPATVVRSGYAGFQLVLPPSVAARLGLAVQPVGVLAGSAAVVTAQQRQALAAALAPIGHDLRMHIEGGYTSPTGWLPFVLVAGAALIAVFAALIATALANVDSRADLVLLAAIGASPRTRRTLSFARAAVIAGIGAVIGALAGVLPAHAWVQSVGEPVVIPWGAVGTAVVGIPLLAASLGWLFTRARLPSERTA